MLVNPFFVFLFMPFVKSAFALRRWTAYAVVGAIYDCFWEFAFVGFAHTH